MATSVEQYRHYEEGRILLHSWNALYVALTSLSDVADHRLQREALQRLRASELASVPRVQCGHTAYGLKLSLDAGRNNIREIVAQCEMVFKVAGTTLHSMEDVFAVEWHSDVDLYVCPRELL